ncbi:alpha/beta fold hydrolase [Aquipuribacter hungaricus]|uniref:Alpha/beta fold hydrolase n=1 Tax=Aquipuribacter hungaricus TaxID=545624 RepID=A0ABV7WFH3_9MICO
MTTDAVAGLGVRRWGSTPAGGTAVLALHGLTGTSAVWADLADRLEAAVVAPDLPGRGASVAVAAAPGLPGLAQAVVRVVDELGPARVVVVGHSMGAFLAPLVVELLGPRAAGTVLLDGGVPPERSLLHRPLVVRALFGVLTRRLVRRWPDVDGYTAAAEGRAATDDPDLREGFRAWSEAVLRPDGDGFRPALDSRRLVADGVDSLTRPSALDLLHRSGAPVHLLAAAHGTDDRRPPFLSDSAVAAATRVLPGLMWERLAANHATMLFHPAVAAAVGRTAAG